jgi:hypothetical protein
MLCFRTVQVGVQTTLHPEIWLKRWQYYLDSSCDSTILTQAVTVLPWLKLWQYYLDSSGDSTTLTQAVTVLSWLKLWQYYLDSSGDSTILTQAVTVLSWLKRWQYYLPLIKFWIQISTGTPWTKFVVIFQIQEKNKRKYLALGHCNFIPNNVQSIICES